MPQETLDQLTAQAELDFKADQKLLLNWTLKCFPLVLGITLLLLTLLGLGSGGFYEQLVRGYMEWESDKLLLLGLKVLLPIWMVMILIVAVVFNTLGFPLAHRKLYQYPLISTGAKFATIFVILFGGIPLSAFNLHILILFALKAITGIRYSFQVYQEYALTVDLLLASSMSFFAVYCWYAVTHYLLEHSRDQALRVELKEQATSL